MENQIEKFDPSTLMQGVKDRIKATFVSLIPDDKWDQMVQKEVDDYFKTVDRGYNNQLRISDFAITVKNELEIEVKKRFKEYISTPEFSTMWDSNGRQMCSDAVKKMIVDNSGEMFVNMMGSAFSQMMQNFRNH